MAVLAPSLHVVPDLSDSVSAVAPETKLFVERPFVVGRAGKDLTIDSIILSSKHVEFQCAPLDDDGKGGPAFKVQMLDSSTNGTSVNGRRLQKKEWFTPKEGDLISIGKPLHQLGQAARYFLTFRLKIPHWPYPSAPLVPPVRRTGPEDQVASKDRAKERRDSQPKEEKRRERDGAGETAGKGQWGKGEGKSSGVKGGPQDTGGYGVRGKGEDVWKSTDWGADSWGRENRSKGGKGGEGWRRGQSLQGSAKGSGGKGERSDLPKRPNSVAVDLHPPPGVRGEKDRLKTLAQPEGGHGSSHKDVPQVPSRVSTSFFSEASGESPPPPLPSPSFPPPCPENHEDQMDIEREVKTREYPKEEKKMENPLSVVPEESSEAEGNENGKGARLDQTKPPAEDPIQPPPTPLSASPLPPTGAKRERPAEEEGAARQKSLRSDSEGRKVNSSHLQSAIQKLPSLNLKNLKTSTGGAGGGSPSSNGCASILRSSRAPQSAGEWRRLVQHWQLKCRGGEQERKELERMLSVKEGQLKDTEARVKDMEGRLQKLSSLERDNGLLKKRSELQETRLEEKEAELQEALSKSLHLSKLDKERKRLEEEVQLKTTETEFLSKKLEEAQADLEKLRDDLRTAREEGSGARRDFRAQADGQRDETHQLRAALIEAEERTEKLAKVCKSLLEGGQEAARGRARDALKNAMSRMSVLLEGLVKESQEQKEEDVDRVLYTLSEEDREIAVSIKEDREVFPSLLGLMDDLSPNSSLLMFDKELREEAGEGEVGQVEGGDLDLSG